MRKAPLMQPTLQLGIESEDILMDYDQITLGLKNVILKEKDKTYSTFETRVGDMARDCLKFIEENTRNQPRSQFEWIDVEDGLPDEGTSVLVAVKLVPEAIYRDPVIAELRDGTWYTADCIAMPLDASWELEVTHWSPLPENPEVEK